MNIIYINCDRFPFVDWIMAGAKLYETRTRNTLKRFIGERVFIAETHKGHPPLVRCSVLIDSAVEVFYRDAWIPYMTDACISNGSTYDWKPDTKKKVLYHLSIVRPVQPFTVPASARRHGRVWCEI